MQFLAVCCFFFLGSQSTVFADEQPLSIVTTDYAPYNYRFHGEGRGYSYELVQALLKQMSVDDPIDFLPWARTFHLASSRPNTLVFSLARTEERESSFHWIGKLLPMQIFLYRASSRKDIVIKNLQDIEPYLIGGILQGAPTRWLEANQFRVLNVSSDSTKNLRMLLNNRIDLLAIDPPSLSSELLKTGFELSQVKPVFYLEEASFDLYLALNGDSSDEIKRQFDAGWKKFEKSKKYQELIDNFEQRYKPLTTELTD